MSKIIIFNGASSSGKSTFIKKLLPELESPFYYYSSDKLVDGNILPVVNREVKNLPNSWNVIRPKFFDGFHRSIKAFADAGNDLIVEHVIEYKSWFLQLKELLKDHEVYFIGVVCPIEVLNKREIQRGDRYIGEGKSHIADGIHSWCSYDLEIDTYSSTPEENIDKVKQLILDASEQPVELWDLYDKDGNKIDKLHKRGEPLNHGEYHMVVENWIKDDKGQYLIQKRTRPLGKYINPWSTTAGASIVGESSNLSIQRETAEEMGLLFDLSELNFIERVTFDDYFMDVYETIWNGDIKDIHFDLKEVSDVKWATQSEIQEMYRSKTFYSNKTPYLEKLLGFAGVKL
ncbi:MAG: NUDIX domain-containing protein [Spirochaetaceae bacterium]